MHGENLLQHASHWFDYALRRTQQPQTYHYLDERMCLADVPIQEFEERLVSRVWNGPDWSAGLLIQSNPDGFGLDWIQRFAEAWITDWTGLQKLNKLTCQPQSLSHFLYENYIHLWNCKLKYFAELWLNVQLRYSMAIGIVFWKSQAVINLKPITWPWTFTKITIKKLKQKYSEQLNSVGKNKEQGSQNSRLTKRILWIG